MYNSLTKLVSIIISTKNRAKLLVDTIDNILKQTYNDIEIIVVDDHSKDNISIIVERYNDHRIKYYRSNGHGPGAARNLGLKKASGEFIKYFDSDDLMTTNLISSQVNEIVNSNADFVYSPYIKVKKVLDDFVPIDEIMHYYPWKEPLQKLMLKTFFVPIPCLLIKKEFLTNLTAWQEKYISYEDWCYLWDISLLDPKISHVNEGCFFYLIHGEQSTENRITNAQRIADFNDLVVPKLAAVFNKNLRWTLRFFTYASLGNHWPNISQLNKEKIIQTRLDWFIIKSCAMIFRLNKKVTLFMKKRNWLPEYGSISSNKIFLTYKLMLK